MSNYNLTIQQGADFNLSLAYKDATGNVIGLTDYTARMAIRSSYAAPTELIRLTTENGMITIDDDAGVINLSITAANTANLVAANAVYDLELVSAANSVIRLIEGKATITPEVTR
jgi:thiamine pyrophosphokinase